MKYIIGSIMNKCRYFQTAPYLRALGATPTRAPLRKALKKAVRAAAAGYMLRFFLYFCGAFISAYSLVEVDK
jgi:hypothetical protein